MQLSIIWVLAQKELRDALRNRWFLLYTLAFIALSLAFSYLALAGSGMVGWGAPGLWCAPALDDYFHEQ